MFKRNFRSTHLLFSVCLSMLFFFLFGCTSTESRISSEEHLEVIFSGYNTAGTIDVVFDRQSLIESVIGEMPSSISQIDDWTETYNAYNEGLSLSYSPQEGLSNGQEITVKIDVSGKAASKILPLEKTYVVAGLKEADLIDVFSKVSFCVTGVSGEATAEMVCSSEDDILFAYTFSYDNRYSLSNGDSVKVSIRNAEEVAEEYNYYPTELTKTYTVSGLPEYLEDSSLISEEQIKEIIRQKLIDEQGQDEAGFTYSEPKYYATYFGTANPYSILAKRNTLSIFVTYDEYLHGEFRRHIYIPIDFYNILVDASENVELKYEDGISSHFWTDKETILPKLEEQYIIEELHIEWP